MTTLIERVVVDVGGYPGIFCIPLTLSMAYFQQKISRKFLGKTPKFLIFHQIFLASYLNLTTKKFSVVFPKNISENVENWFT